MIYLASPYPHEIARCDREIAAMWNGDGFEGDNRTWLWLLGWADWETEKRLIEQEIERA